MRWLTRDATLICDHTGRVKVTFDQTLVTIKGREVLIATDPEGRDINLCPNVNPAIGMRACAKTLPVIQGYSTFITIKGNRVCLDSVRGLTDGSPPGIVNYKVTDPGQQLVGATS